MSNTESSKKAAKRDKVEKLSIEAALKNISNSGIRSLQTKEEVVQKDGEVNKILGKGKEVLKGKRNSKNMQLFSNGDSSEESSSEEEFPKHYSSENDSNESSSDGDFPLSKIFNKTKSRKKQVKKKTKKKTSQQEKFNNLFSSGESSEEETHKEDKETYIVERDNVRDESNEELNGKEANDRNEHSESNLPSTEESHKSRKSKRNSRPSSFLKVGGSKMKVQFNDRGQPIGEASVRFSSILGGIAAEMVPLMCSDWRGVPPNLKSIYWLTVQQKFIIDEARKAYTLQQIGKLWRAHKSRLRKKIRACKTKKELKEAKPENIGIKEWTRFAKQVFKRSFMKKSKRYQELRATQDLPHTCSRKGYARLEDEMKKESSNPESITRVDVWSKGHTKKDGTPSNQTVSVTMEKIQKYRESPTSVSSSQGVCDDALSKVLGPERCGRVRGLGSGVTPSKVGAVSENKAHVRQLQEEVGTLKEDMTRQNEQIARQNDEIARQNEQIARQNEISVQQNELIKKLLAVVQVQQGGSIADLSASIPDVSALISENMVHPSRNINVSKVQCVETNEHILAPQRVSNPSHSIPPTQVQCRETIEPQRTSNLSQSGSQPQAHGNANIRGRKCKLMNWSVEEELVAIGRWETDDPNTIVHFTPLGENASRVWVVDVINGGAPLWRINSFMETMADAKSSAIAWPNKSIVFDEDK